MWPNALVHFGPLLILQMWAAREDVLFRRIRNEWVILTAASGLAQAIFVPAGIGWHGAAAGVGTGLVLSLILYRAGALGGGDVKLMMSTGAWLGAKLTLFVFLWATVIAMFMAAIQMLVRAHRPRIVMADAPAEKIDTLPFAVPVLLGTLAGITLKVWAPWR
jgi:prepilin peptidase CpaA